MATVRSDLLDRIRELERKVRELAGRSQTRPPLDQIRNGNVKISEGGQLMVTPPDSDGHATFAVGQWPDGAYGTVLRRTDGTYALTVAGEKDDRDAVRIWSRDTAATERILVSDDQHADRFLGRPWIPLQLHPTANQRTSSTSWAHAWLGVTPVHNAVAHLRVTSLAEAGGHVRVRVRIAGKTATVDEWELPAGEWTERQINRPLNGAEFLGDVAFQVEHRSAKRAKPIETRLLSAYTRNTFEASEAPKPPAGQDSDARTPDPRLDVETDDDTN